MGWLILIARFARPGALYYASVSSQAFEAIGETIANPSNFEEVAAVNVAKFVGKISYSHMPGFENFNRKFPDDLNIVKMKKIKRPTKGKPIWRCVIYCIRKKSD